MGEQLRVRIVGDFRLDGADLSALRSRKARTLLKILAVHHGAVVTVDALVDALWAGDLPADPARDLSVLASRARAVVGNERLVRRDNGYMLIADWCDRDEVLALTREAARRHGVGDEPGARIAAEAALALGSGSLLADEVEAAWARSLRAEMDSVVAEARSIAASAALASGHAGDAAAHARAALGHDPFDETALRILMRAHVAAGRPASALAAYAQTRAHLADELGVSPTAATEALHESILLGDQSSVGQSPVHVPVPEAPLLVGRRRELGMLDAAFLVSRRDACVVVVSGEAGVGKTRLVEAWAAAARQRGVLVLAGRASEDVGLALQPVLDALAAALPAGARTEGASMTWTGVPGPSATSAAMQEDVFKSLDETLRASTPPAGLVMVIDDIHLADPVTIAWLNSLIRRPTDRALLVVVNRRTDEDVAISATTVIDVGPLDQDAVAELVGEERAAEMWRRSGGNALLLTELAGAEPGSDEDAAVPVSVREAVAGRLRRVDDAAAATLRTAALLGATIDLDLLAGVLAASPLDVLAHLDEGVRRAFLAEADGQMVFRHELVRAAIGVDATAARRAWVHGEAARLLRQRPDANPLELARHALAGGDLALAADALADAADLSRARFDLAGAERLLDQAVDVRDGAAVRLRRSRLRMARDDLAGADSDAEAALGLGAGAKALELRAWVARNRHDMETAIRLGTAGAELAAKELAAAELATAPNGAEATDLATTRASCLVAVGLAHRGVGELVLADRLLAQANALQPSPSLGLDAWIGVLRVHQGRPADALAALEPMVGAEAGGLLSFWVEHVVQMLAHAYGQIGRASDALAMLDRVDVELQRRGSGRRYGGGTSAYRSWILRNLGVPGADDMARIGMEQGVSPEVRAQSRLDLADALIVMGRFDDAGAALAAATDELQMRWFHNRWRAEQRAGAITTRLLLANGLSADALATATATAEGAGERGDARYATIARLLVARCNGRLGNDIDRAAMVADLVALESVAGLEAWWLAADVADDTGSAEAAMLGRRYASRLVAEAGKHADAMRAAAARRFS